MLKRPQATHSVLACGPSNFADQLKFPRPCGMRRRTRAGWLAAVPRQPVRPRGRRGPGDKEAAVGEAGPAAGGSRRRRLPFPLPFPPPSPCPAPPEEESERAEDRRTGGRTERTGRPEVFARRGAPGPHLALASMLDWSKGCPPGFPGITLRDCLKALAGCASQAVLQSASQGADGAAPPACGRQKGAKKSRDRAQKPGWRGREGGGRLLGEAIKSSGRRDPQSLDAAVQNTLAVLYPPFDVTGPTVLSQLFHVLEAKYHGDGLCCLLDFLIPSKRLLEHVRQAACAPYVSCVFLHEGWPLCLREKVVVHLGPLNPLLVRPGDFYLQAEPCGEQSASLAVKCLSRDLTTVEKIPIPEAACSLLFTQEWLEEANRDLGRPELRNCLVATSNGIVPVPWSTIVTPEFVQISQAEDLVGKDLLAPSESQRQTRDGRATQSKYPGLIKVERGSWTKSTLFVVPSLCDIISENLEGEYVNLLGFSEERKPDLSSPAKTTASPAPQPGREESPEAKEGLPWATGEAANRESWTCGKGGNSEEGPCTPCLRRKLSQDPELHEARCHYRESYVAALQNPVSFSSGLMAAILEEMDAAQPAPASESTGARPSEGSGEAVPGILTDCPNKEGKAEQVAKPGHGKLLKPPADSSAAGSKFSFLKGHRLQVSSGGGLSMAEKAGKGQEGPRKRPSVVCSPRTARAKQAGGKGASQVDVVLSEVPVPKSLEGTIEGTSSLDTLPPGSSPQDYVQWEMLSSELLSSGIVCLPGSTDRLGRPILQITTSSSAWQAPGCSAREVADLLLFLCSLPRKQALDAGLTVVVDARKEPLPPALSAALDSVQKASPGSIRAILILAEKETVPHVDKFPGLQVELLSSLKALSRHVDSSQLTPALEGTLTYCHTEWVQYFQKMHHFMSDLQKASQLLQSTVQELEEKDQLESLQEVLQELERHQLLMQGVLSNGQLLSLQREGGATLARLRKEAARLSFSLDARSSIDCALGLYNLVEEQVHTLVTRSNGRLEHLQFLRKIRELEAEFRKHVGLLQRQQLGRWEAAEAVLLVLRANQGGQQQQQPPALRSMPAPLPPASTAPEPLGGPLGGSGKQGGKEGGRQLSLWMEEEGGLELRAVESAEGSQESAEESYQRFKKFFKEATVHYNRGLSLSKEAAKVQGSRFPEMEAFEAAKGAFQAKLTVFYMEMERRGAELETLLDLYKFCDKVTQLNLDCKQHLSQRRARENEPWSTEAMFELESSLQLSPEFSSEKFQQMKVQASSMHSGKGLEVWHEALEKYQEAKQVLEGMLAKCRGNHEGGARVCGEKGAPLGTSPSPPHEIPGEEPYLDGALAKTRNQERLLEYNRRSLDTDRTGSQENPSRGAGKEGFGREEPYLASPQDVAESRASEGQNPNEECPEGLLMPTRTPPPLMLHTHPSCPKANHAPETWEDLPSTDWTSITVPGRGRRSRRKEAAQYFQLSRHGSFSSEDTDSQNSTEESLGSGAAISVESAALKGSSPQGKALGIVYLENHSTTSLDKATSQ
uniref:uncharacterized protein KIAA1755 homolog n=1 Tax=Euleptes europaea TaxID=460621 RepID=UPI002541FC8B|nr:uncharacterized protein KIAA1755 homolog [Euleptes europaea]